MEVSNTYFKVVGWCLVFLAVLVASLNVTFFNYSEDFWQNLMVEIHGSLLDALLFMVVLHFLLSRSLNAETKEKANSTLDSLRNRSTLKRSSKGELFEAIRTLQNTNNVMSDIHFNHDLSDISLSDTVIENCFFDNKSNLSGAEFTSCTFKDCELIINLAGLRQSLPKFNDCTFIKCNLNKVKGDTPDFQVFDTSQFSSCDMSEDFHIYANNEQLIKD